MSQQEKASCLFLSIGDEIRELIAARGMMPDEGSVAVDHKHCDELIKKLEGYFKEASDATYDLNSLFQIEQQPTESAQRYETRVRRQANVCDLGSDTRIIRAAFVKGMRDRQTATLANANNWTLEQIVKAAVRNEAYAPLVTDPWSNKTPKEVEVFAVDSSERKQDVKYRHNRSIQPNKGRPSGGYDSQARWQNAKNPRQDSKPCANCGMEFHKGSTCPAMGKSCNRCGKRGHYGRVCRQAVNELKTDETGEDKVEIYS